MPMYFPDLKSVQQLARSMRKNEGEKQYIGIYPENDQDLPEARIQLGRYLREIWGDRIAALEVELAVTEKDYHQKLRDNIFREVFR